MDGGGFLRTFGLEWCALGSQALERAAECMSIKGECKKVENEPEIVLAGVSVGRAGAKGAVNASKVAGMFEATGDLRD